MFRTCLREPFTVQFLSVTTSCQMFIKQFICISSDPNCSYSGQRWIVSLYYIIGYPKTASGGLMTPVPTKKAISTLLMICATMVCCFFKISKGTFQLSYFLLFACFKMCDLSVVAFTAFLSCLVFLPGPFFFFPLKLRFCWLGGYFRVVGFF